MKNFFLALMLLTTLANCDSTKTVAKKEKDTSEKTVQSGSYTVVSLYDETVTESNPTIVLNIEEKSISGFSGCNTYSCVYEQTEALLTMKRPLVSKRFCPEQDGLEQRFLKALSECQKMLQETDGISFMDKDGTKIIRTQKK